MLLTKHKTPDGSRWAVDSRFLQPGSNLSALLEMPRPDMLAALAKFSTDEPAAGEEEAPIDPDQEVWAAGVTYLRSRDARRVESKVADLYDLVYAAARPELFFKSIGWRVVGDHMPVHLRADSHWNVPEPELVLVINCYKEVVGYCAGNDVSSRDIEGENPLYLPQAKIYNGSCALGHGIWLCESEAIQNIPVRLEVRRKAETIFTGEANTSSMKRALSELVDFLTCELDFPRGVFLMTGTCLVPEGGFTLQPEDTVLVEVGRLRIENKVRV